MAHKLGITGLALVLITLLARQVSASPNEDFRKANEAFAAKEYEQAITLYTGILDQGLESAALYFNLGNAYFKQGNLGHAILNYLRAKRLAPDDDDIADNLAFARTFTRVQMEGVRLNPIRDFLQSIVEPYRLQTLAWATSAVFVSLFAFLTLRFGIGLRRSMVRSGIVVSVVLLLTLSFITTFKYRHDYLTSRAVMVAEDCPVRTGPSEQSEIELEAAPGVVVEILSEAGDYYNVMFENKRRGWIRKHLVAVV